MPRALEGTGEAHRWLDEPQHLPHRFLYFAVVQGGETDAVLSSADSTLLPTVEDSEQLSALANLPEASGILSVLIDMAAMSRIPTTPLMVTTFPSLSDTSGSLPRSV